MYDLHPSVPLNQITPEPNTNCGNLMSAACVTWQGPDIACINVCAGESIQDVVFDLSTLVCNLVDVNNYNTEDLTDLNPETLTQIIQIIIDQVSLIDNTTECDCEEYELPIVPLADCVADHLGVTELPLDTYVRRGFSYFCDCCATIEEQIATIEAQISKDFQAVQSDITSITNQITIINQTIATLSNPTVITQCASYSTFIGEPLPIETAFHNFEGVFCNYITSLGTSSELQASVALQCTDLAEDPSILNPTITVGELANFVTNSTTLADSVSNLWVTVCDLRAGVLNIIDNPTPTCIALSPKNLQILSTSSSACVINFEGHGLTTVEEEVEFQVSVYGYNDVTQSPTSSIPLSTQTAAVAGDVTIDTTGFDPSIDYIIEVKALYSGCGYSAPTYVVGRVVNCSIVYRATLNSYAVATTPLTCNSVAYNKLTRKLQIALVDPSTGAAMTNVTGSSISLTVKLRVTDPFLANDVWEQTTLTILNNQAVSDEYEYVSFDRIFDGAACNDFKRGDVVAALEISDASDCRVNTNGTITIV